MNTLKVARYREGHHPTVGVFSCCCCGLFPGSAEFDAVSGADCVKRHELPCDCRSSHMPPIDSITKEQLTRALGQAVIRI
jgi:hypothetical protein